MRNRLVLVGVLAIPLLAGCGGGKKTAVNIPAVEPTAILYPFEPIPVASYEGMGLAQHKDLRIAQEMARTQAMTDLGSSIFEIVSSRVTDVVSSRGEQTSFLNSVRSLATNLPLTGKRFVEYKVGKNSGTVYCRVYMAKSEVDGYLMDKLVTLSQNLLEKPIQESLTKQIAGAGVVNADVQSLALFNQQQLSKAKAELETPAKKK